MEDGVKREVRVTFAGKGQVRWQAKRADENSWTYDFTPTVEEWDELVSSMEARYQRRNVPLKDLELVRRLRDASGAELGQKDTDAGRN
jgi:hypothetical protein